VQSSRRTAISHAFAALGVLLFVTATVAPAVWYPVAQFFAAIACFAVSHALTPCEDDLTPWWKTQLSKLFHRH
jgi:hypothetical protein